MMPVLSPRVLCAGLLFVFLVGCKKNDLASTTGDAGDDAAAASASASATVAPSASATGSATSKKKKKSDDEGDPSDEGSDDELACEGDVCRVGLVTEDVKAELEKLAGYKTKRIQFRDNASDEQLKSVALLTWATKVSLDGCKNVTSLAPIAELKGLREFSAAEADQISDITPLAGLTELEKLDLKKTAVEKIDAVKGLAKLQKLDLSSTKVVDLGPIGGLSKLTMLGVSDVKAKDWSPLQRLTGLKHLEMARSDIKSAYILGQMKGMKTLILSGSKELREISALRVMIEMDVLKLDDCPINTVQPLSGMLDLHRLSIAGTKVTTVAPLSNLTELKSFDAQRTAVADFDPLAGSAKSLHYLGLPKGTTADQYAAVTEANPRLKPDIAKKR